MNSVAHWSSASLLSLFLVLDCSPEDNHVNDSYLSCRVTSPGRRSQEPPLMIMIHLFASSGTNGAAPPLFQVGAFIHVSGLHAARGLGCYLHSCRESVLHSISRFRERFSVLFFCISTLLSVKNCFVTRSVAYCECNLIAGATDHCVVKWVVTFFTITFLSLTPSLTGPFHPGLLAVRPYAQVGLP